MRSLHSKHIVSMLTPLVGTAVIAVLAGGANPSAQQQAQADFAAVSSEPANVGDAKIAALAYHDSGTYDRDLRKVAEAAGHWLANRATAVTKPALVLDIDETSLSNWEIIKLDDFGRPINGPCVPESNA